MSVSRPLLLGLGGLALLGVVQWVILPAFEYRADNASRAERARQRHLSMQLLTDDYARLSQSKRGGPGEKTVPCSASSTRRPTACPCPGASRPSARRPARKTTAPNASRCALPAST